MKKNQALMARRDIVKSNQKRLLNIKKKCFELSTLCDVDVCFISFSADKKEINTWPEDPRQFKPILTRYIEHRPKFNKSRVTMSQFQPPPFVASDTDNIASLLSGLSSNSLKIFSDKLASKIEQISNRIERLQPSIFFTDRIQPNSNLCYDNSWTSFLVNHSYPMPLPEANVVPAAHPGAADNPSNNEFSNLYSNNMNESISLQDSYLPDLMQEADVLNRYEPPIMQHYDPVTWLGAGEGYQLNDNLLDEHFPSNPVKENNAMPEISNRDDTLVFHGETLLSSDDIQFPRTESSQISRFDEETLFLLEDIQFTSEKSSQFSSLDDVIGFFESS